MVRQVSDSVFLKICLQVCYAFILRTIRRFKDDGSIHNDQGQRHRTLNKAVNGVNSSRRKTQAMSRHKYIYVIGTVLIVDLLFLCPYSGIQLVAFLHINHLIEITHSSTLIRWWLQVFIGVHSVCQPLCYFRMTEFRRLACCLSRTPWNKSKSYSVLNKSYGRNASFRGYCSQQEHLFTANTRSVLRDEDLLDPPDSPQINDPLLEHEHVSLQMIFSFF
ncbi:hypothetical protein OESDEN_18536, partial [Oesophagostomum dentatum]